MKCKFRFVKELHYWISFNVFVLWWKPKRFPCQLHCSSAYGLTHCYDPSNSHRSFKINKKKYFAVKVNLWLNFLVKYKQHQSAVKIHIGQNCAKYRCLKVIIIIKTSFPENYQYFLQNWYCSPNTSANLSI